MRIRELEELLKTQKKYDNYFTGNILDSNSLQSELSVLQKPIIDAIITENPKEKVVVEEKVVENPVVENPVVEKVEKKVEEEIKPTIKININVDENIKKVLKEKTTMPLIPKNLHVNRNTLAFPSLIPQDGDWTIDEKKYLVQYGKISKNI